MVRIVEVDLPDINLPADGIRLVIMQAHIQGHLTAEPFKWRADSKDAQLARIKRTLEIAKAPDLDIDRTHFTVLPECAIPGLDGVDLIHKYLNMTDWPAETIVIGGIEWLTKKEYAQLIIGSEHDALNGAGNLNDNEYVNCCITWVKTNNGVKRFIQPKISRAWVEHNTQHTRLFEGKCVYLFQAKMSNSGGRVCLDN
jgi:predicted amidohydrolase